MNMLKKAFLLKQREANWMNIYDLALFIISQYIKILGLF